MIIIIIKYYYCHRIGRRNRDTERKLGPPHFPQRWGLPLAFKLVIALPLMWYTISFSYTDVNILTLVIMCKPTSEPPLQILMYKVGNQPNFYGNLPRKWAPSHINYFRRH